MVEKAPGENRAASAGLPGIRDRRRSLCRTPRNLDHGRVHSSRKRNGNENDFIRHKVPNRVTAGSRYLNLPGRTQLIWHSGRRRVSRRRRLPELFGPNCSKRLGEPQPANRPRDGRLPESRHRPKARSFQRLVVNVPNYVATQTVSSER